MSKKKKVDLDSAVGLAPLPYPSSQNVSKDERLQIYSQFLTPDGAEVVSSTSRTVAAHLPTLGERIRRYLRNPDLVRDQYHDEKYWDPEEHEAVFNEDGLVVAPHEERYQEGLKKAQELKAQRDEEEKQKKVKEESDRRAERRQEILDIIKEGSIPPVPPKSPE